MKRLVWVGFAAAAVAVVSSALVLSSASARPTRAIRCGPPAARVDRPLPYLTSAIPLGDVLWLGIYPYRRGYPTKVIVAPQRAMTEPLIVRGRQCTTGKRLRFWYRDGDPFARLPVSAARLRAKGALSAVFGPWAEGGEPAAGGFFNFWAGGRWKITASIGTQTVAAIVVQVVAAKPSAR